jgi:tripartite-type tricarboxylate transporter receptor subunit TctC
MRNVRSILVSCLAIVAALIGFDARAVDYPVRPIKLVVPYAAGGPTDVLGRLVAEYLGRDLKQATIVENKAGAQGAIGAEAVARAEPDGYTLFVSAASIIVLNPMLYKKLPYDPVRDFRMLALVTDLPVVMEIHPSVPAKTVAEFVAYAKQNPGKLNFGSAGHGNATHLAAELFKLRTGIDIVHVPYKGAAEALTGVLGGQVHMFFGDVAGILPLLRDGALRALAISSETRSALLPDLPTMIESGVPDYVVLTYAGVVAPAGTAAGIIVQLNAAINASLSAPEVAAAFVKLGAEVRPDSAQSFAAFLAAETEKWANVVKTANIKVE